MDLGEGPRERSGHPGRKYIGRNTPIVFVFRLSHVRRPDYYYAVIKWLFYLSRVFFIYFLPRRPPPPRVPEIKSKIIKKPFLLDYLLLFFYARPFVS